MAEETTVKRALFWLTLVILMVPAALMTANSHQPTQNSLLQSNFVPSPSVPYPWVAFSNHSSAPTLCSGGGSYSYCFHISVYGDSYLYFDYVQPGGLSPDCVVIAVTATLYQNKGGGMCQDLFVKAIPYNSTAGTASFPYTLYYNPGYIGSWSAVDVPLAVPDGVPTASGSFQPSSASWTATITTATPSGNDELALFFPAAYWTVDYPGDCPSIAANSPSVTVMGSACSQNRVAMATIEMNLTSSSAATLTASYVVSQNFSASQPYTAWGYYLLLKMNLMGYLAPMVNINQGVTSTTSLEANWALNTEPYMSLDYYLVGTTGPDAFSSYYKSLNITQATSVTYYGLIPSVGYQIYVLPVVTVTWFGLDTVLTGSNSTNSAILYTTPGAPTLSGGWTNNAIYLSLAHSFLPNSYIAYAGETWAAEYVLSDEVQYGPTSTGSCSGVSYTVSGYLGLYSPALQATVIAGSEWPSASWSISLELTYDIVYGHSYCFEAQTSGAGITSGAWSSPLLITATNSTPPIHTTPPVMPHVNLNATMPSKNVSNPPNGLTTLVVLQLPSYQFSGGYFSSVSWTNHQNTSFSGEFVLEAQWLADSSDIKVSLNGRALTPQSEFGVGNSQVYVFGGSDTITANGTALFTLTFIYTPPSPLGNGVNLNGVFYSLGELYDLIAIVVVLMLSYLSLAMKRVGSLAIIGTILIFLTIGVELFG